MAEEALPPVSMEVIEQVRKSLELDERRIKEAVEGIKQWLRLQPHLPMEEDDGRLERWLIRCKNSMEKTKKTLDLNYTLKTLAPELMCNWDVNQPWFDTVAKFTFAFPMPVLTDDMDRISLYGFFPTQNEKDFDAWDYFKTAIIGFEIRIQEDYNLKDIIIVDFKNCTLKHVIKYTLPLMKKAELCLLRGYHCRLKAIYYINTPAYADVLVGIVKSVIKSKLVSRIHVHGSDLTEFHKQVPKEFLPVEMGGNAGTIQENWDRWQKKIKSYRDWLLKRENMKSDESKRTTENVSSSELFGFEGSFRTLTTD